MRRILIDRASEKADLNATILHALGIAHEKLTFKFQGLEDKRTGVIPAKVLHQLFA